MEKHEVASNILPIGKHHDIQVPIYSSNKLIPQVSLDCLIFTTTYIVAYLVLEYNGN